MGDLAQSCLPDSDRRWADVTRRRQRTAERENLITCIWQLLYHVTWGGVGGGHSTDRTKGRIPGCIEIYFCTFI